MSENQPKSAPENVSASSDPPNDPEKEGHLATADPLAGGSSSSPGATYAAAAPPPLEGPVPTPNVPTQQSQFTGNSDSGNSSEGGPKQTVSTRADFGSVVLRQDRVDKEGGEEEVKEGGEEEEGVLKKLGPLVWRHRGTIMTFTLPTLGCMVGILGTFFMMEHRYSEYMVQKVTDRVVSNNHLLGEALLEKYLKREDAGKRIVTEVIPVLREEAKQVTYKTVNNTRIEYMCLLTTKAQWKRFEKDLKIAEKKLRKEYEMKLGKEMDAFKLSYEKKLNITKENLTREMNETKKNFAGELQENQKAVGVTIDKKIGTETETLNGRLDEIFTTLGLRDQLLEVQGFLKIDSIGPVLVVLGVVEALLSLCICVLFGRSFAGAVASRPPGQQRGANATAGGVQNGGDAVQQQQQRRPLINTNNSNVVCLCFRDADEKLSRRLGTQLVESCRSRSLHLRTFVINCMEDVQEIPACRAALVFVDPDEREMIVEDERYHIGQGLRRHAIQRLLDSGVEVFIVIFNDKRSVTVPSDQMYNTKLGQVDEHAQLKRLKRKDRVVSIKDQFHQHQTSLIIGEFNTIFG